ncbi:MAG: MFS transporter [Candidatus Dormibacteraeota bacterium]|nr:MFS transporter [Candidatus Dormibacteraeota bacterium]
MADVSPGFDESSVPGTAGLDARVLWTLLAGNALTMVGIGFFLPILPLLIAARGGGAGLVGLVFASGVVARALIQYPAGRLSDRIGRRPVIVGSLVLYALIFPLYVLHLPPATLLAVRFLHALAAGGYEPAALALVADLTRAERRGAAFSRLRASDTLGLLLGPALGGLVAGFRLEYVFWVGAVVCLGAAGLMLGLPRPPTKRAEEPGPGVDAAGTAARPSPSGGVRPARLLWQLVPVLALGFPILWTFGAYDTVWSLYMTSRGADTFLVGLSFATYALPVVAFAGLAAGLADRLGWVRAGTLSLISFGLLAASYPFVASVAALILIGFLEGTLTAAGQPALSAEVSRVAPEGAQGRTQGLYQTGLNVAQVVGAVAAGWLYEVGPVYAFLSCTAVCLMGAGASALLRRARSAAPAPRT